MSSKWPHHIPSQAQGSDGGGRCSITWCKKNLNDAKAKLEMHTTPSMYLDVQCSDDQVREFGHGADFWKCSIMSYACVTGDTMEFLPRSLTKLGMSSHTVECKMIKSGPIA
jgi:hypothetical protein